MVRRPPGRSCRYAFFSDRRSFDLQCRSPHVFAGSSVCIYRLPCLLPNLPKKSSDGLVHFWFCFSLCGLYALLCVDLRRLFLSDAIAAAASGERIHQANPSPLWTHRSLLYFLALCPAKNVQTDKWQLVDDLHRYFLGMF